jgi:hypothetical protein
MIGWALVALLVGLGLAALAAPEPDNGRDT